MKKRIREGRITVNDAVAKKPDLKVDPEQDQILFDHRPVIYEKYSYYLFHKPAGCVTARCDRLNRTVMDFFPESMRKEFAPVGRLDKDTEGFLLITNDGELTHRLLSPAYHVKKTYFVQVDLKMPDMDGIETARQIRKRIGKEITIIVLTSYEFSEIEEEAKAAGVDAFIAKPLFRSRLTVTLRQFTSGRKEKTARNYLDELSEADYTGKRILLVEDNELNREIAVEILQMTGAEVETAENGKIAVEKVEASPEGLYDLVFMDIQMPVMNGYEATAAIRSLPGEKGKLPIVAMTANAFAEDVQLAKNTGMNGHIAKPLDMNKLNDVLESWL